MPTADKMFASSFNIMIFVYVTHDHKSLCVNKVALASYCSEYEFPHVTVTQFSRLQKSGKIVYTIGV